MAAVQQNGYAIEYINAPSEAVQMAAVNQNGCAIFRIKNPSEAVLKTAVARDPMIVVTHKNPSESLLLIAVKEDPWVIQFIKNPSESVQMAAVAQSGFAVKHIKNPSEAVQRSAVHENGNAIQGIKDPSEAVQLMAVNNYGGAIEYIENPSEAVQLAVVHENFRYLLVAKKRSAVAEMSAFAVAGVGFSGLWPNGFFPSGLDLAEIILKTGAALPVSKIREPFERVDWELGFSRLLAVLRPQPAEHILALANAAPDLFDNTMLTEILRDALLERAEPTKQATARRTL